MPQVGMQGIGEIHRCCTFGQFDDAGLRGEDKNAIFGVLFVCQFGRGPG